jgi:hypothetical protein
VVVLLGVCSQLPGGQQARCEVYTEKLLRAGDGTCCYSYIEVDVLMQQRSTVFSWAGNFVDAFVSLSFVLWADCLDCVEASRHGVNLH